MPESSRFRQWPKPTAYPFYDIITGDTSPGEVFDLGVDVEGYDGSVFIKPEHIVEMARALGMATKEEVELLLYENRRLQAQVNALPDRTEELKNGLATLVSGFLDSLSTPSPDSSSVEESAEPERTDGIDGGEDGSIDSADSTEKSSKSKSAEKLDLSI